MSDEIRVEEVQEDIPVTEVSVEEAAEVPAEEVPAVEKELRNYCLVVGDKDDVQCTAPEVVPLPSSPPPAIVPTPEPGYASVHKPPRVQNFMESGSGDLVFDSNGDNTVVIDETKINSLMQIRLHIFKFHEIKFINHINFLRLILHSYIHHSIGSYP